MAKRLTAIEHLAREICWLEFSAEYRKEQQGTVTKAAYWQKVGPNAKHRYVQDAERMAILYSRSNGFLGDMMDYAATELPKDVKR